MLLGFILEHWYGMPYGEIVRRGITIPLRMDSTTIVLPAADADRIVQGYDDKGTPMSFPPDQLQAAASLKSTVRDMLKYIQWQVAEKDSAVRLSHEPTWRSGNYSSGLNWQMLQGPGVRVIWQDGTVPGFDSLCVIYPELNMGIVILTNEASRSSSQRVSALANAVMQKMDPKTIALP
jgi:CubicO group peptidase (beta-lactamase class C family)